VRGGEGERRIGAWAARVVLAGTALLPLLAAGWARVRAERVLAARMARTTANYLAVVTPAARGGADYDLPQLLAQANALATLPPFAGRVEVYRGTAPLVRATAGSLTARTLQALREGDSILWSSGAALAPLKDRGGQAVVGAVAITRRADAWRRGALGGLAVPVVVVAVALAVGALRGRAPRHVVALHAAAALLVGLAAYGNARGAAAEATDRWLEQTRLLMQEAAGRLPPTDLQRLAVTIRPLALGSALVARDSTTMAARRETLLGERRAVVGIRLGPGRWLELRTRPGEAESAGWLWVCLVLAALGPAVAAGLRWVERGRARPRQLRETLTAWGFLAPATLHLAVFSCAPVVFLVYLSLHRWNLEEPVKPLVGLGNFAAVMQDPVVWLSLRNTLLFTLQVPLTMGVALGIALLLRRNSLVTRLARTAFLLPYVSSGVAIALVWQWMYHPDFGIVNTALSRLGVGPVDWLGNPDTALLAVMIVSVWTQTGYQMVVFLAALQTIPETYLEAARVDGAGAWRRFWRVTFPLLKPVTLFVLVTGIISSFQTFTSVYVLTGGGPLHATDVLAYRIYQTAWGDLRFGEAGALALLLFALLFAMTWTQFKLLKRRVEYA
jgi:ABC-type sugar transport system permease subunit